MNKLSSSIFALSLLFAPLKTLHADVCLFQDEVLNKCSWIFETKENPEKNRENQSFRKSKKRLQRYVYNWIAIPRETIYCWCSYLESKEIDSSSCNFQNNWKYKKRSQKIEWEHIVPTQAFWQFFTEWKYWDEKCVTKKWKTFKWRKCASKTNMEYKYMQSDIYNLYPANWSLNAQRSNYIFWNIPWEERNFWSCDMEISQKVAEPRNKVRWDIARIYMYMQWTYPKYEVITWENAQVLKSWHKADPVSPTECKRSDIIKTQQWNTNFVLKEVCK